jgi:hypothetical protein
MQFPSKSQWHSSRRQKSTLRFIWKPKRSQIATKLLSKKINARVITITDFNLYYRAMAIKNSMVPAQKQV